MQPKDTLVNLVNNHSGAHQQSLYNQMKHKLEVELDFITDLSPLELASKVAPRVRETVEAVCESLDAELEFDIFLVLDGREVRFVMDPV